MFYLDLRKHDDVVTIKFKEADHSLGKKWAVALRKHIDGNYPVAQPERIYNLNNEWSRSSIVVKLNECIDIINNYRPVIDFRLSGSMTQQDSNKLHNYFEILRGENESPNEFYTNSPSHIKRCIEEYNVLIHRWEDYGSPGRIVVHLKDRPVYLLDEDDFRFWTLDYSPGDVRLNYCHKGKPLWDVFKDGDDIVGDDNIRPQFKYSPDFNITFGKGPGVTQRYLDWWKAMGSKLNNIGLYKDDPKCAVGHAVIGKVIGDPYEVKEYVSGSTSILGVRYDYS